VAPNKTAITLLRVLVLLGLLYLFLSAISLMGTSFKLLGHGAAEKLMQVTSNPFVGLLVGLLVTSLVQSSSVTTSMVVALVSGGALTLSSAVPVVMGANMGTTVTNTIVSLGHITRNDEFERAYAGATVHDFFNLLAVAVLFPLELATHWMERAAELLSQAFYGAEVVIFQSPIKFLVKPVVDLITSFFTETLNIPSKAAGAACIALSVGLIFFALTFLVKVMRVVFARRVEGVISKIFGANLYVTMFIGILITALIQSSSITTSILIPLLGAGIITLSHAYPLTLGANIGTTVTALIAALAGNQAGLTIAFVHLIFNLAGTSLFFPIPYTRKLPIYLARKMAAFTVRNKKYALVYIAIFFFLLPLLGVFLTEIF
jgi:sodium-dependent phosphate cotransporter